MRKQLSWLGYVQDYFLTGNSDFFEPPLVSWHPHGDNNTSETSNYFSNYGGLNSDESTYGSTTC